MASDGVIIVHMPLPSHVLPSACASKGPNAVQVHRNITMALSTMLHFFIDIVVAFLFTIFMTELTKVATGVLR